MLAELQALSQPPAELQDLETLFQDRKWRNAINLVRRLTTQVATYQKCLSEMEDAYDRVVSSVDILRVPSRMRVERALEAGDYAAAACAAQALKEECERLLKDEEAKSELKAIASRRLEEVQAQLANFLEQNASNLLLTGQRPSLDKAEEAFREGHYRWVIALVADVEKEIGQLRNELRRQPARRKTPEGPSQADLRRGRKAAHQERAARMLAHVAR